jgi:hypothetical protein
VQKNGVTIGDIAYPNCFVPPPLALDLRRAACEASRIPKVPCRRRGTKARRRLSGETAAKLRSLNVAFSRGSRKSFSDRPPRTCSRSSPDFIFIVGPTCHPPRAYAAQNFRLASKLTDTMGKPAVQRRRCSHLMSNSPFTQRFFPTGVHDGGRREPLDPPLAVLGEGMSLVTLQR